MKYTYRKDIRDRATLEANFREKYQQLNRVRLTDEEFARQIVTPDVFYAYNGTGKTRLSVRSRTWARRRCGVRVFPVQSGTLW